MTDQPTPHRPADAAAAGEAGEPQDAAMSADEMVAAIRLVDRNDCSIVIARSGVGRREARCDIASRCHSYSGVAVDPLAAFAQAYAAYQKAQEEQKP